MPTKIANLYGGGVTGKLMAPRFLDGDGNPKAKVSALLQRRHTRRRKDVGADGVYRYGNHEWKVPIGVLYYWHHPLRRHQMVVYHPWWVTWISPRSGKRLKKEFTTLPHAVHFIATRAQYVDPSASIIAKHPYDVIPALRGKLPRKHNGTTYYWCPLCMTARPFYAVVPERSFTVNKKTWREDKGRYVWTERAIRLMRCRVCLSSNLDTVFRRSNQPWEKRRFKRGVRRARRKR
jgi:hypothetical protein